MVAPRFFETSSLAVKVADVQKPLHQTAFIDVGDQEDCGFRAIAAGIIDNILINPLQNQELVKQLLERHFQIFPKPDAIRFRTTVQRVHQMVCTPHSMAEFIQNFAYTLKQVAVDELVCHPEKYPEAFIGNKGQISPVEMRKPLTWLDKSAIDALANATRLPIYLRVVEPGKDLHRRLNSGPEITADLPDKVVIQLQNNHYTVQVSQPDVFAGIEKQQVSPITTLSNYQPEDPAIAEILKRIDADQRRIIDHYQHNLNRLSVMFIAGEINKQKLLDIYVSGMSNSDAIRGRIRHVGLENGNQSFFAEVIAKAGQNGLTVSLGKDTYEQHVAKELIDAIARSISIGQLDQAMVYAQIENDASLSRVRV